MKDRRFYNQVDKKIAKKGGYEVNDIHRGPEDEGKQASFERRMKRIGKGDKIKSGAQKKRIKAYMGENIYSRVCDILEGSLSYGKYTRAKKRADKDFDKWADSPDKDTRDAFGKSNDRAFYKLKNRKAKENYKGMNQLTRKINPKLDKRK